jgi:PD-(D/E)XK nuclease superfamily
MSLPENSSFSERTPGLQLAFDSTSLTALKECPRKYYYSIVEGWQPRSTSVHLTFGILIHEGKERYDRSLAAGSPHDEAVVDAIEQVLLATWDSRLGRPWTSDDSNKNRETLVRTLTWYFEEYRDDPIRTVVFSDGKPAVELSFSFPTDYRTSEGEPEPYVLCGHIDRLGELNGTIHPCDVKTTAHTITEKFFSQFTPHTQFSLYSFATRVLYVPDKPIGGLIVDAAQVAVTFSRFERREVPRSPEYLTDWYRDLGSWFRLAETYAREGHWPMNESACGNYGGCPFRIVCSHPPSVRSEWLRASFIPRVWDPLQARGDI